MTKAADRSTTDKDPDRAQRARSLFFVTLFDLSWRLAAAFLTPVLAGVLADTALDTGSRWTIVGIVVGVVAAAYVVRQVIHDLPDTSQGEDK